MVTIYRGISGSQFVFSEGSPPAGATSVTIFSEGGTPGGTDKGSFPKASDLPNTTSGSADSSLLVGDFATVNSESVTFYCSDASQGFASWSQLYGEPTDIPNLEAWWESDRGITVDGSNGVISWADWTGKYLLTSSTADRPNLNYFFVDNGKSFRPSVTFSGSQRMAAGDVLDLGTTSMTWFLCVASNPTQQSRIIDKRGTGAGPGTIGYQVSNIGAEGDFDNTIVDDGTQFIRPAATGDLWGNNFVQTLTVQMDRSAGRLRCFVEGISEGVDTDAAMINWNITNALDFAVGQSSNLDPGNEQEFTGEIMAMICFRDLVSGSDRNRMEAYLNSRYRADGSFNV